MRELFCIVSALNFILLAWLAVDPRVMLGLMGRLGFSSMALGFLALLGLALNGQRNAEMYVASFLTVFFGLLVALIGVGLRELLEQRRARREKRCPHSVWFDSKEALVADTKKVGS